MPAPLAAAATLTALARASKRHRRIRAHGHIKVDTGYWQVTRYYDGTEQRVFVPDRPMR